MRTTARTSTFLVLFGGGKWLTRSFVCAHFGAPQRVVRYRDGTVGWLYGSAIVVFKGNHAVEGAGFNR